MKRFGVSTHLYHEERLQKAHLLEIAANGFESVELFATRSHFDYHDASAIRSLKDWLTESKLALHSVHAPITDVFANGRGQRDFSTATRDGEARKDTLHEMAAALDISKTIPFKFLVVHLGIPLAQHPGPDENDRDAAIRSIEGIHAMAQAAGVTVTLEVMGNELSTPSDLIEILERNFEDADIGICMDVGHARMMGDVVEAIEACSGHVITTHLHDNRGRSDDHLVPGKGVIDWDAATLAFQKVGYDGVWMFELAVAADRKPVLEQAAKARARLESLLHIGDEMMGMDEE